MLMFTCTCSLYLPQSCWRAQVLHDTNMCQKSWDKDIKNASGPKELHIHTCVHPLFPARSCGRLWDLQDAKRHQKIDNKKHEILLCSHGTMHVHTCLSSLLFPA